MEYCNGKMGYTSYNIICLLSKVIMNAVIVYNTPTIYHEPWPRYTLDNVITGEGRVR